MIRRRWLLSALGSLLLGALGVLAFAPFNQFWLMPLVLAALLLLVAPARAGQAFGIGFAFGLGQFLAGISWVEVSLGRYGGMPGYLAWPATFLFCAFLALFPATATVAGRGGRTGRWLLLFPAAWTLAAWSRGHLFTGFPWLVAGYSQLGGPLAGFAPVVGVYGVTFAVVLAAGLLACVARRPLPAFVALLALGIGGYLATQVQWTHPDGAPVSVRLVQGDIPLTMKWDPAATAHTLAVYQKLARGPGRLVVLPETALPVFDDELPAGYLDRLQAQEIDAGADLLYGIVERDADSGRYYNAVVSTGVSPEQDYRKHHLVPFGEYVPPAFQWLLTWLHIPMSDFSPGSSRPVPMHLGPLRVAVNICYEDAFGEEIIGQLPAANLLVNVTDDAWFGDGIAAAQHLDLSRMRALETGRWVARATNTGVTAAIDPAGRVEARLPQWQRGVLVTDVVPYGGATPYVRWGNWPVLGLSLLLLLTGWGLKARKRS